MWAVPGLSCVKGSEQGRSGSTSARPVTAATATSPRSKACVGEGGELETIKRGVKRGAEREAGWGIWAEVEVSCVIAGIVRQNGCG